MKGGVVHFTFAVHNDGYRPATITAVDLNAAGLDHGHANVHFPKTIAADHDLTITATFIGLQCNDIDPDQFKSGIRISAHGDLPLTTTVTASLLTHFTTPFQGMRTYRGTDPLQIGWPAGITQQACTGT